MEVEAAEEEVALVVKLVVVVLVMRLQVLSELHVSIKSWIFESMAPGAGFADPRLIVSIFCVCVWE